MYDLLFDLLFMVSVSCLVCVGTKYNQGPKRSLNKQGRGDLLLLQFDDLVLHTRS